MTHTQILISITLFDLALLGVAIHAGWSLFKQDVEDWKSRVDDAQND